MRVQKTKWKNVYIMNNEYGFVLSIIVSQLFVMVVIKNLGDEKC